MKFRVKTKLPFKARITTPKGSYRVEVFKSDGKIWLRKA